MLVENIRLICKEKGLSVNELEKKSGITPGNVCRWDKSKPSVSKVKAVADCLGVTVDELLREADGGEK